MTDVVSKWTETNQEWYEYVLEVLPPAAWQGNSFMGGDPLGHGHRGVIYETLTIVDGRYFTRTDYLIDFDDEMYEEQVRKQFNLNRQSE